MYIFKDFLIFIIGILIIIKSANFFTDGSEGIANFFRLPRIFIGLTIVSLATTFPEFTVSVISSYMKAEGVAVGNATGSCIANIGLILALAAIIRKISLKETFIKQELIFLIAASSILYLLLWDGQLSFSDGIILCFLLIAFFFFITKRAFKNRKNETPSINTDIRLNKYVFKFLIGSAGVILSAKYAIIPTAVNIANYLKVPEIVIGLTIVAVGTSLPELVTALVASVKRMGELAVGNIIGANILNTLWVLGWSAVIRPLTIDNQTKFITMPFILGLTLLLFIFFRTKLSLSRREGSVFFLVYWVYIFYIFNFAYR